MRYKAIDVLVSSSRLTPEEQVEFDAEWRHALLEAAESLDLSEVRVAGQLAPSGCDPVVRLIGASCPTK